MRAVKRDPKLAAQFAGRIGDVNRFTFNAWARIVIPSWIGTTVAMFGVLVGLALIAASEFAPS